MSNYRVGIDCRLAGKRHAGIGRYTVELVKRVTAHTEIDWVLFYSDLDQIEQIFPSSKVPNHCQLIHTPVQHYTFQEQWHMNAIFTKASLDLLHVPHFNIPVLYSRPLVITIHDLLWHEHRGAEVTTLTPWKYWIKYGFYRLVTRAAVAKALRIFVPTKAVQQTLEKYFPTSHTKTIITPEGISEELLEQAHKHVSTKRNPKKLLYVGSLYPHKNVELILKVLKELPEYFLTIVSSRTVFREKLKKKVEQLGLTKRVIFLSNITDEKLAHEYQTTKTLIQPSFSEGFGLTGIEAMAFNTPVLASDIPVFHEVYGEAALYFNPRSTSDLTKSLTSLENKEQLHKLAQTAPQIVQKNDWETLAKTTLKTYQQALQITHE